MAIAASVAPRVASRRRRRRMQHQPRLPRPPELLACDVAVVLSSP